VDGTVTHLGISVKFNGGSRGALAKQTACVTRYMDPRKMRRTLLPGFRYQSLGTYLRDPPSCTREWLVSYSSCYTDTVTSHYRRESRVGSMVRARKPTTGSDLPRVAPDNYVMRALHRYVQPYWRVVRRGPSVEAIPCC